LRNSLTMEEVFSTTWDSRHVMVEFSEVLVKQLVATSVP